MYLRAKKRIKDGKEHRYWSIVEPLSRDLDGAWCNAKCCISARSTIASESRRGAAPSRWWKRRHGRSRSRCFPRTDRPRSSSAKWSRSLASCGLHRPAPVGRMLAGAQAVGASGTRPVLDRACRRAGEGTRGGYLKTQVCYRLIAAATGGPASQWYEHSAIARPARQCDSGDCPRHVVSMPGQAAGPQAASSSRSCASTLGRRCSTRASISCSTT